jgi:hypothetical protein
MSQLWQHRGQQRSDKSCFAQIMTTVVLLLLPALLWLLVMLLLLSMRLVGQDRLSQADD